MLRFWKKLAYNRKIFTTLFFCTFCCVIGVGIVVPLLPVYAKGLGANGLYIGLIFVAFSISKSIFLPIFARLSDKKGRKPFVAAGLFCYALISFAFMAVEHVDALIAIRFVQGIASAMILPVTQAYIGDISPTGDEGFSMGLYSMSVFIGLSLGPLIGGVISDKFCLDAAFFCMGVLALIGFFLSYSLLPPTRTERVVSSKKEPAAWKTLLEGKNVLGLFSFRFAYTTCIGMIWGFLPVYADIRFSLPSPQIGVLAMAGVFTSGLIHIPMGAMADRFNKSVLAVAGGLIVSFSLFSFQWADGFWALLGVNVLFGLGGGIAMPSVMALTVAAGAEMKAMGSVMGVLALAHSLGMMTGAILAGVIMDVSSLQFAYECGALIMLMGVILFGQSVLRTPSTVYNFIKRSFGMIR